MSPALLSCLQGALSRLVAMLALRRRSHRDGAAGSSRLRLAPCSATVAQTRRFPGCADLCSGCTAIAFHRGRQSSQRYLYRSSQPTFRTTSEAGLRHCRSDTATDHVGHHGKAENPYQDRLLTVAACPKTARIIPAAAAYRWNNDFLPPKSSEINRTTKADAAGGNFARGAGLNDYGLTYPCP